jgi:heterogeneous nuclear rnp K-like protein
MASKSKRQTKNAAQEDPYATARVRIIVDPEQADVITAKLGEIQLSGAAVAMATVADGTIERIVTVGGSPETVGKVVPYFFLLMCLF